MGVYRILVLGSGKIGSLIAMLLSRSHEYAVRLADIDSNALDRVRQMDDVETLTLDASDADALDGALRGCQGVVSALSYRFNPLVAEAALRCGASYFDLTEDVETSRTVRSVAAQAASGQVFVPQCGLAPGFISMMANHLAQAFDRLDTVHMRVGALPQFPSNALNYNLTWSTDGLINEYCNLCEAIHEGRRLEVLPLEGLESFSLDGVRYEAFNTSGGLGTLCETFEGRVRELNYRTIRYVGHRELMHFLIEGLRLGQRREVLKEILEQAVPAAFQDVVVIFCAVTGWESGRFLQLSDARKIYPQVLEGRSWSAIQITTAAGICALVDLHVAGRLPSQGFVKQEDVSYGDFINNRFGGYYRGPRSASLHPLPGDGIGDNDVFPGPARPQAA